VLDKNTDFNLTKNPADLSVGSQELCIDAEATDVMDFVQLHRTVHRINDGAANHAAFLFVDI